MVAGLVLAGAAWGGTAGWRLYEATLLPLARSVPTHTPTPVVDPVVLREEGRRQRAVTDHIAAGNALLLGNQRAGAAEEYRRALALGAGARSRGRTIVLQRRGDCRLGP